MEFFDLITQRYSVRGYVSRPVEEEKLAKVLEAAVIAPTAANRQPFRLIVVPTRGREAELKRIYARDWFVQAPLVICACGVGAEAWRRKDGRGYVDIDVTIAMDHLILAAHDLGLGTCWIGAFDPAAAREVLGLEPGLEPLVFTPLGYPAVAAKPKQRRPLADLVRFLD
jgi:nitroreductase